MTDYRKLLVAVDLSDESAGILRRAVNVADNHIDRISVVHVVEPVAAAYPIDAYAINMTRLQEEALKIATHRLGEFAEQHGIPQERQFTLMGPAASEIRNKAEEIGAELIVIGSHGRAGWKLLLGSTANKVLHGAPCDVLTVLVSE